MCSRVAVFAIMFLILSSVSALAGDESPWCETAGGVVSAMKPNPSVHMVSDHVDIRLGKNGIAVKSVFVLRNEGNACTVQIGSPERLWAYSNWFSLCGRLEHFFSYIDGKKANIKRVCSVTPPEGEPVETTNWSIRDVEFGRGQTRTVKDDYYVKYGWSIKEEVLDRETLDYVLGTGAAWKGRIDEIVINVDGTKMSSLRTIVLPKDALKVGLNRWRWTRRNIEPCGNFHINLLPIIPLINGKDQFLSRMEEMNGVIMVNCYFIMPFGGHIHGDFGRVVPAGGGSKKRTCVISYGRHTLRMKEGSLSATLDGRRVTLPARILLKRDIEFLNEVQCLVPLNCIVKWFGGSVTSNRKTHRLNIRLKGYHHDWAGCFGKPFSRNRRMGVVSLQVPLLAESDIKPEQ